MFMRVHFPPPPLDLAVETIICFGDWMPGHGRERVLPEGRVELIVDLTETPKSMFGADGVRCFRASWISGTRLAPIEIDSQNGASFLIVRFRPGGAAAALGVAAEAFSGHVVDAADALGRDAAELRETILRERGPEARIRVAERWLKARLGRRIAFDRRAAALADALSKPSAPTVAELAQKSGLSERSLGNLFQRHVGLSPKQFSRVRRFNNLLTDLDASTVDERDWAGLAASHGYYDQSHMIHDFTAFAGLTPERHAARFGGQPNFLALD